MNVHKIISFDSNKVWFEFKDGVKICKKRTIGKEVEALIQAKEYIKNGYVWNSGIFIWNTYTIKRAFLDFMPQLYEKFQQIKKYFKTDLFYEKLEKIYDIIEPISIDIGIIEQINNIRMVLADYEWRDIGNLKLLLDLYYNKKINLQNLNNCSLIKSNNIITFSEDKERKFAIIGLENIVVVDSFYFFHFP